MTKANLIDSIKKNPHKPSIELLVDTGFSKEIRIYMSKGQEMKERKAPYPIVVEIFDGNVDFRIDGIIHTLSKGDILCMNANAAHYLFAQEDSIIRLSLYDSVKSDIVTE